MSDFLCSTYNRQVFCADNKNGLLMYGYICSYLDLVLLTVEIICKFGSDLTLEPEQDNNILLKYGKDLSLIHI